MYREEEYIDSLRADIVDMVSDYLTPVALQYGYSDVPLEDTIKWYPLVLLIGNYSSGKSTLINDFLGGPVQATGQAPTDDSFTVIIGDESVYSGSVEGPVQVTEVRDGKYLLNDPQFPFSVLKKYGQRFASHFCLKRVNSPVLRNLAIIDTPGMHDSISQHDRGYNYQSVIGDLAAIADLVLVLFDPHKAGTIREAHTSLRDTLPRSTSEDRVRFVLNRIDECASFVDLLKVYGTLCWNLSQITGRKDIPTIHLTYAAHAAGISTQSANQDAGYMKYLDNEREKLKAAILDAPRHRLDHLASFVELHAERLAHFLEALVNYREKMRLYRFKTGMAGIGISILCGLVAAILTGNVSFLKGLDPEFQQLAMAGVIGLTVFVLWILTMGRLLPNRYHGELVRHLDQLTPLNSQIRKDSWKAIKDLVQNYIQNTRGKFSLSQVRREYQTIYKVYDQGNREIRDALAELAETMATAPQRSGGASEN